MLAIQSEQMLGYEHLFKCSVDMLADTQHHLLLYKIARAYYCDGLTQEQIAKRFRLSRPKVSRLLSLARAERVVNITITPPSGTMADMEYEIERRYDLEEVISVSITDPQDETLVARELAPAAADCIVRRIRGDEVVGITWGTTMMAVVDALAPRSWPDVTIVQMNGGMGPVDGLEHSIELTRRMAKKFNAKLRLLSAPGIVSNRQAARALKSDKHICETLALAAKAAVAIVGIGALSPDSVLMRDGSILSREDFQMLRNAEAVGDVALRYIDAKGRPVDLEINERIIGISFNEIKRIPCVIAVAGGAKKYQAIRAALMSKVPDVLVTDHVTTRRLLTEPAGNQRQ